MSMEFILRHNPWANPGKLLSLEGSREDEARLVHPQPPPNPETVERDRASVLRELRPFVGRQVTLQLSLIHI